MMRLSKYKVDNYLYKKTNLINKECLMCNGENIYNNHCVDCGTKVTDIYYSERIIKPHKHSLNMEFNLSKSQEKASHYFLSHLVKKENAFLNAVCGSGKTEIMYESILYALNNNLKVVIAIPRREIVKELSVRLKNVFKDTVIKYIDGSNHDDNCDLLLSTVNQLINYENEFDLIILDEADAYPYSDNLFLKRILRKSLKDDGVIFYMSATIKERFNIDTYTMNRRYHGHDLVLPKYYLMDNDITKNSDFLKIINGDRKHIIYVPSISILNKLGSELNIDTISSESKRKDKLLDLLKNGTIKNILSTTILERGITIKNVDVIVLYADHKVFTYQTLIQIAGRVGRKIGDETGNVYIFYRHNSIKFFFVNRYIKRMNNEMLWLRKNNKERD